MQPQMDAGKAAIVAEGEKQRRKYNHTPPQLSMVNWRGRETLVPGENPEISEVEFSKYFEKILRVLSAQIDGENK